MTKKGHECLYWEHSPTKKYQGLEENHCRNLDAEKDTIWCITSEQPEGELCETLFNN